MRTNRETPLPNPLPARPSRGEGENSGGCDWGEVRSDDHVTDSSVFLTAGLTASGCEERRGRSVAAFLRRIIPERMRPIGYLTRLVRERTHRRVRLGPFAGMRYADGSVGSAYLPKLLGIYERELVSIIEQACVRRPERILNVGAGEGYYAVGLALRNPQARVIAFESRLEGQSALRQMAGLNHVAGRIEIRGCCDPNALRAAFEYNVQQPGRHARLRSLVLCDAEGDELDLLEPRFVPELRSTDILVESHDFIRPGITEELLERFTPTHHVERIWQTQRSSQDFPFRNLVTRVLPRSYLDWAVSEWRPARMCWLWMKTRE